MTLQEMMKSERILLNAGDVAEVIQSHPQDIRNQAKVDPVALGFPVCVIGARVKIPRTPLLRWLGVLE